jgi:hypothetical protein
MKPREMKDFPGLFYERGQGSGDRVGAGEIIQMETGMPCLLHAELYLDLPAANLLISIPCKPIYLYFVVLTSAAKT